MSEYIKKSDVRHLLLHNDREAAIAQLDELESVDAVPVVRCRDCQWFDANGDYYDAYCDKNGISVEEDFFCADGERKDGADDGRTC